MVATIDWQWLAVNLAKGLPLLLGAAVWSWLQDRARARAKLRPAKPPLSKRVKLLARSALVVWYGSILLLIAGAVWLYFTLKAAVR
jgi:hypothetical protein